MLFEIIYILKYAKSDTFVWRKEIETIYEHEKMTNLNYYKNERVCVVNWYRSSIFSSLFAECILSN